MQKETNLPTYKTTQTQKAHVFSFFKLGFSEKLANVTNSAGGSIIRFLSHKIQNGVFFANINMMCFSIFI